MRAMILDNESDRAGLKSAETQVLGSHTSCTSPMALTSDSPTCFEADNGGLDSSDIASV